MTTPAPLPYDAIEHIRLDGTELIRLVSDADPTLSVSDLSRLEPWRSHVPRRSRVELLGRAFCRRASRAATMFREIPEIERPPEHRSPVDALFDAHVRLCDALHAADASMQVWTWTGSTQPVPWVARRMTHETMVHLWDAGQAIGLDFEFAAEVAADGIDEWLTWFAAGERAEGERRSAAPSTCTAPTPNSSDGARRVVRLSNERTQGHLHPRTSQGRRGHSGPAQDILMWLWRRSSDVEIIGDEVVARRFQAFTDLT